MSHQLKLALKIMDFETLKTVVERMGGKILEVHKDPQRRKIYILGDPVMARAIFQLPSFRYKLGVNEEYDLVVDTDDGKEKANEFCREYQFETLCKNARDRYGNRIRDIRRIDEQDRIRGEIVLN